MTILLIIVATVAAITLAFSGLLIYEVWQMAKKDREKWKK